jgi:hypothetical protein
MAEAEHDVSERPKGEPDYQFQLSQEGVAISTYFQEHPDNAGYVYMELPLPDLLDALVNLLKERFPTATAGYGEVWLMEDRRAAHISFAEDQKTFLKGERDE